MNQNTVPTTGSHFRFPPLAAWIGAGVLVASLGAAAGWMAHSSSAPAPAADASRLALAHNETLVPPSAGPQPAAPAPEATAPAAQQPPAAVPAPAPAPVHSTRPARTATHHAATGTGSTVASNGSTPLPTQRVATCDNCGVIEGVRAVQRKASNTSGVGAVGGAVVGGALGNTMGHGSGRAAMTILGALGGGLAGNEIEKRVHTETVYEVQVRMDDGSLRTFTERTSPTPGARVRVENGALRSVSAPASDNGGMMKTSGQAQGT